MANQRTDLSRWLLLATGFSGLDVGPLTSCWCFDELGVHTLSWKFQSRKINCRNSTQLSFLNTLKQSVQIISSQLVPLFFLVVFKPFPEFHFEFIWQTSMKRADNSPEASRKTLCNGRVMTSKNNRTVVRFVGYSLAHFNWFRFLVGTISQ